MYCVTNFHWSVTNMFFIRTVYISALRQTWKCPDNYKLISRNVFIIFNYLEISGPVKLSREFCMFKERKKDI